MARHHDRCELLDLLRQKARQLGTFSLEELPEVSRLHRIGTVPAIPAQNLYKVAPTCKPRLINPRFGVSTLMHLRYLTRQV